MLHCNCLGQLFLNLQIDTLLIAICEHLELELIIFMFSKTLEEFTMQHSLNQVRMIATDMDGTLLNSQDQMPRDFFDLSIV